MTVPPVTSFAGLGSGIDFQSIVNRLISVDQDNILTPIQDSISLAQKRSAAWGQWSGLLGTINTSLLKLSDGSAFGSFSVTTPVSPISGASLFSASADPGATPGTYGVEVLQLAQTAKVGSAYVADSSAALGLAGTFTINGGKVAVAAGDSLAMVRDKINALNTGVTATRVSAAVVTSSTGARLVLSSADSGAAGMDLVGDGSGVLQSLGFATAARTANIASDGRAQSIRFASSAAPIGGVSAAVPPASSFKVNGTTVSVDLAVDSLASIQSAITAAGGTASIVTESAGGRTWSRLLVTGSVTVNGADANSAATLDALGFQTAARTAVAQVLTQSRALTDAAAGNVAATNATLLTNLGTGSAAGTQVGDVMTLRGVRQDGTAFAFDYTVAGTSTVGDMLAQINGAAGYNGTATAALDGTGRIVVTDARGGASLSSLSVTSSNTGGGTLDFGAITTTTAGMAREIVQGQDARVRVDGAVISRATNVMADAIPSATLTLTKAELGTTIQVVIGRDVDKVAGIVSGFATAYNAAQQYVKAQQTVASSPLHGVSSLRRELADLKDSIMGTVPGLPAGATYTRLSQVGVTLDKAGVLQVDSAALKTALAQDPDGVRALFASKGTATGAGLAYNGATDVTKSGTYAVSITQRATQAAVTTAGFSGSYATGGTPDTMTLTDVESGKTGSILLANGDTTAQVIAKLNAMFAQQGLRMTAAPSGSNFTITHQSYGSAAGIGIAYTNGSGAATGQLGLAAGTSLGLDVAGTLQGAAATGRGQTLIGATGSTAEGLSVTYTGAATGAVGSVNLSIGLAQTMAATARRMTRAGDGLVAIQQATQDETVKRLTKRFNDKQDAITRKRETLLKQYNDLERTISKIRSSSSGLSGLSTPQA